MPTCSTEAPPVSPSGTATCPSPRRTRRPKQDGTPCPSWHPRTSPHCLAAGETPWTTRTSQRWTGSMADPRNDSPLFDADAILRKAYFGVWLLSLVFAGFAIWGVIRYPHWSWALPIEERIEGVAFIATAAGEVGARGLPRSLLSKYNPLTRAA